MAKSLEQISNQFKEQAVAALKAAGNRITQQRIAVIDCIAMAKKPLSATDIFALLEKDKQGKSLDKVSVYRVLDTLLALDLIHRIGPSGDYIACCHQQCQSMFHVLIRCSECEKVEELDVPPTSITPLMEFVKKSRGFLASNHMLQMDGKCANCS